MKACQENKILTVAILTLLFLSLPVLLQLTQLEALEVENEEKIAELMEKILEEAEDAPAGAQTPISPGEVTVRGAVEASFTF